MQYSLIDSHAHLDYDYDMSTNELIAKAQDEGISHIISITAEPQSLERVSQIANSYENVFHTSGIHPHDAVAWNDDVFATVKKVSLEKKCIAIGEIGLDYYYENSAIEKQIEVFRTQLEYSVTIGKPVVIHSRDAEDDTIEELRKHSAEWKKLHPSRSPGVIHCFSSSRELADAALDLGYFISFSGIITFKNAENVRSVLKEVPIEKILVETDAPFLAPVPHRGKKNIPGYTRIVAEKVAELKQIPFSEVAKITRQNTIELFQLPLTI